MGRIPKTSSRDAVGDDLRTEMDQIDRLLARLRRTTGHGPSTASIRSAESTLAKRYAAFTPSGDAAGDRAALLQFQQQATSLLRKGAKQQRDGARRGASVSLGSR